MIDDLRVAWSRLVRHHRFAAVVVVCFALGLGVNVVMFGLVDRLFFQPPPHVREPGDLARLYVTRSFPAVGEFTTGSHSHPTYADLADSCEACGKVLAYLPAEMPVGRGGEAHRAAAELVSPGYFDGLGVRPYRGRFFTPDEASAVPGGAPTVVLGHDYWRGRFGGSPEALGETLAIGERRYTVIGVAPPRFRGTGIRRVDLWLPLSTGDLLFGDGWRESRGSALLQLLFRLPADSDPAVAAEAATAILRAGEGPPPVPDRPPTASLGPLMTAAGPETPREAKVARWLFGLSLVVLLIACANVAILLLIEGERRRRETAVAAALGAGPRRLVRQRMLEVLLLAVAGAAAALAAAWGVGRLVASLLVPDLDGSLVDHRTLGFAAGIALASASLTGLLPALRALRSDPGDELRGAGPGAVVDRGRLHGGLAIVQVALTLALLFGAGLYLRSLHNVETLDLGFDIDRLVLATSDLRLGGYEPREVDRLFRQAASRVSELPGVESAAVVAAIPFDSSYGTVLDAPGREIPSLSTGGPYMNGVSADVFATLGLMLIEGRGFVPDDDRPGGERVVVVNETLGRTIWPGESPIGECLKVGGLDAPCSTVVGMVENSRRGQLREDETMQLYLPLAQLPEWVSARALFVRAAGDPEELVGAVRREVQALSPDLPFVDARPAAELLAPHLHPWRLGATVFTLFGLLALVLALTGVYAVLSYGVARQRHELGVRLALGASRRDLSALVLRRALGLTLVGLVCGLVLALGLGRAVEELLFDVSPHDPLVLGTLVVLLLLTSAGAAWLPARRAGRLDPVEVLREE